MSDADYSGSIASRPSPVSRSRRRGLRSFRRRLGVTVVILALICATLVVLDHLQGPKLQAAQIDTVRAVSQPNQQLRLFANELIAPIRDRQVTITPATPFVSRVNAGAISVQFQTRLLSGVRYSVVVRGVTSAYEQQQSTFNYSFTTDAAQLFYLDRRDPGAGTGADGEDSIIETGITAATGTGSADRRVVYSARHIQSFVRFGNVLAVALINDDHSSALRLVALSDKAIENVVLPGKGQLNSLAVSDTGVLGFVYSSVLPAAGEEQDATSRLDKTLLALNLAGSHQPQPVLGLGNHPFQTLTWLFIPGGAAAAVLSGDNSLFVANLGSTTPATPLGQFSGLMSAALDGSRLVVSDPFGPLALDIATRQTTRLPPNSLRGVTPYGGDVVLVGKNQTRIQEVVILDSVTGSFSGYVVLNRGLSSKIIYQNADQLGNIETFRVSPNGQYVAVTVVPDVAASVSDHYASAPESTSVATMVVEVATARVVRTVAGFDPNW